MNLLKFPTDFIWGAGTASYQIEGAAFEDGKGLSIWDTFSHIPGNTLNGDTGDVACDHYHRMESDVALMSEIGLNAYRFSISWPRVLPGGYGEKNQNGIDFYNRLVDELLKKDIVPFVTLYHWDLPMALQNAGGWLNRRIVDWFVEYSELMYRELGDRVKVWTTHNEPNISSCLGYLTGTHPPGVKDFQTYLQVIHHILLSHGAAVKAGRAILSDAQFGIVPAIPQYYPFRDIPEDRDMVEHVWNHGPGYFINPILKGAYSDVFTSEGYHYPIILNNDMETISQPIDFLGINHYASEWITRGENGSPKHVKVDLPANDRGWIIYPDGFKDILSRIKRIYGNIPIYIMENGASFPDTISPDGQVHDIKRKEYYKGYIGALHNAIASGVDVRGYFAWSLMDNYEWEEGYSRRFGIVYVDFLTQKRIVKDSAKFYGEVIRNNGVIL